MKRYSIVLVAALMTPAQADQGDATAAGLRSFEAGRAAFDAGRYDEALTQFQASDELLPSPNSRLYIARCFRKLKRPGSAYTQFKLAGKEAQDRIAATNERRYAATRDAALAEAAEIEAEVPRLTILVPDAPEHLVVKKNGAVIAREAWGIPVETDPGDVLVEAHAPRHAPLKERITLRVGEQRRITLRPSRIPTARVVIAWQTRPAGVALELDGEPVDAMAASEHEVDVGTHVVTAHAPGYAPFRWQAPLVDGEKREVLVALHVEPPARRNVRGRLRALSLTVGVTAVAALGTAAGLFVDARQKNTAELAKSPYARSTATRDAIATEATVSSALFVTGAVLAVGGGALAYFGWRSERAPSVRVTAGPTRDGAAMIVGGNF